MEFTFLGTSAGAPTNARNVTGLARSINRSWDLFDCGEATQHQLLKTHLSVARLSRVFISHLHGDHCYGLFGLLGSRSMANTTSPLTIYGPSGIEEMVTTVLRLSSSKMQYPLEFVEVADSGGVVVETDTETITAVPLAHRVASVGWQIVEADRLGKFDPDAAVTAGVPAGPLYAQLQRGEFVTLDNGVTVDPATVIGPDRPGRRVFIAGDNADPEALIAATGELDLLIHESTYIEPVLANMEHDFGHSTAARVAQACEGRVANLALTHFSPRFGPSGSQGYTVDDIREEASTYFTGNLVLAEDFDRYSLSIDGDAFTLSAPRTCVTS